MLARFRAERSRTTARGHTRTRPLWPAALIVGTALVGRALFYVLVIPTTMPGAFFWRNPGFEEHARATGLAKMPQVGVLPDAH